MLIQHARLVDAEGEREGDVLIRDGRIAAVGAGLAAAGGEPVLDAAGGHARLYRFAHPFPHAGL